jgi:integrase
MGKGSIINRSKDPKHPSYHGRIDLGRDPITNKRIQKSYALGPNKKEAEKKLQEILVKANQGKISFDGNMKLEDYLHTWLRDHAEKTLALKTHTNYRYYSQKYIIPYIGQVRLNKLKREHIEFLHTTLANLEADTKSGKLSNTTIRNMHRVLRAAMNYAKKRKYIVENPMDDVSQPREIRKEMQYFNPEQTMLFMEKVKESSDLWRAFFAVALTTGMRLGELRGLRWKDIDLEGQRLTVFQNYTEVSGGRHEFKEPKSKKGIRTIALGPNVVHILSVHKDSQSQLRANAKAWTYPELVFTSDTGKTLCASVIRKIFKRLSDAAGVPRIRVHDMRHTAATLMFYHKLSPKLVSERLGHAGVEITLNVYAHVIWNSQLDAAQIMDAYADIVQEKKDSACQEECCEHPQDE